MTPIRLRLPRRPAPRALMVRAAGFALFALAAFACTDSSFTDPGRDRQAPQLDLNADAAPADSVLAFTARVKDNLGIKRVAVALTGPLTLGFDTTFTSAVTDVTLGFNVDVPKSVPRGSKVTVRAQAFDGAGNLSAVDTLLLTVGNVPPPQVFITSPTSGTPAIIGKSLLVAISGKTELKIRSLGYAASGVLTRRDSSVFNSPLRDSVVITDTLDIPAGTPAGTLTLTPFLVDSLGQVTTGPAVTLSVQTSSSTRPTVVLGITPRIEVTDTVHVEGTAPAGVSRLGYEVRDANTNALYGSGTVSSTGNLTSLIQTFTLRLSVPSFPTRVRVTAFAEDANGTRAEVSDTVQVVAGVTRPLPIGGRVADALYHPPTDAIYLTNVERNQLEIFSLRDSTFKSPVVVGSRPWGVAAWPRDRDGNMGDTLLVANSGGTTISYVNLANSTEFRRYYLPNIIAYSVTSVLSQLTGQVIQQRTVYDFSDRPQYIATACQTGGLTPADTLPGASCAKVFLVYSTTPTGGQPLPFPNRGTVRWENLTDRTSHFFFEQAMGQAEGRSDTLEIERFPSQGEGAYELLVPYQQRSGTPPNQIIFSIVVDIRKLAFRDTTYVRTSGNFRRAIVGEGGPVLGSRALSWDATRGFAPGLTKPVIDTGVSRPADVTDYVANTFAVVRGAGINFDGSLAAIRADSTYIINPTLRLLGLLQTAGGNAGFDFHPCNNGPGPTVNPCPGAAGGGNTRLAFAASSEPQIEIYDTYCYRRVAVIPVRDPIVGPVRSAYRRGTGEIVLVGATGAGVVIASLPNNFQFACP